MVDKLFFGVILFVCFTVANAGVKCSYYDNDYFTNTRRTNTQYCTTSCCGDMYNRYCCAGFDASTGMVVGIVLGVLALIAIIVSVLVAVFCCCRKSTVRTGQVLQPTGVTTMTSTGPVYGMQTATMNYSQAGYTNAAFPPIQTSNVAPGTAQKWEQPPPYDTINPN